MLGFLKKLFKKEVKLEQESIQLNNLASWINNKTNANIANLNQELNAIYPKIEQEKKSVGSVPPDPSPVFLSIPLKNGEEFPIDEVKVTEFEQAYPTLDIRQQLREMRSWSLSNPQKRKTQSGIMRHINGWLADEANNTVNGQPGTPLAVTDPKKRLEEIKRTTEQGGQR